MKFMLVSELFPAFKGGAENHVFRMLKELQRRGHEVCAVIASDNNHINSEQAGFPVMKLPEPKTIGYGWGDVHDCIRRYNKWIHLNDEQKKKAHMIKDKLFDIVLEKLGMPDVFITHMYWAFMFKDKLKSLNKPIVFISHNGNHFSDFDIILYNSNYSLSKKRTIVNPKENPIIANFDKSKDFVCYPICLPYTNRVTSSLEFQVGQIKLIGHKGPEVFYNISNKYPMFKFLAVQGMWKYYDKVEKGHDNVTLVPAVEDIEKDFFSKIEVYLHYASYEDFGMAALESMGFGIPVVSKGIMGLKESVGDGGILTRDPEVEVGKLLTNKSYYNEIRERQFKHIQKMHDETMKQYDVWLKRLEEIL